MEDKVQRQDPSEVLPELKVTREFSRVKLTR